MERLPLLHTTTAFALFVVIGLGSASAWAQAAAAPEPAEKSRFTIFVPQTQVESEGGFIIGQSPDQMLGSNLMQLDVIGSAGERIGPVEDLLVDRQGRILGVLVDVGGFLGIGQRTIAVAVDQVEFVLEQSEPAGTGPDEGSRIQSIVLGFTREQLEAAPAFTSLADKEQSSAE